MTKKKPDESTYFEVREAPGIETVYGIAAIIVLVSILYILTG